MKFIKLFGVLLIIIFILGCSSKEEFQKPTITENETDLIINKTPEIKACEQGWQCLDDDYKGYFLANCTLKESIKCETSCEEGECKIIKACTAGWKCIDENRKGYQEESCNYVNKEDCDWKCEEGECIVKPENYSEPEIDIPSTSYIEENLEEEDIEPELNEINYGESSLIDLNGTQAELSIYFMDVGRVKLEIDGIKSDWLMEGETFGFQGSEINVDYIIFQPERGRQIIGYTIN